MLERLSSSLCFEPSLLLGSRDSWAHSRCHGGRRRPWDGTAPGRLPLWWAIVERQLQKPVVPSFRQVLCQLSESHL